MRKWGCVPRMKKTLLRMKLFRFIDVILRSFMGILLTAHSIFSLKQNQKPTVKLFLFLNGGLGDIALRVPLLQNLSNNYEVTVLVPKHSEEILLRFCGKIKCLTYDRKKSFLSVVTRIRNNTDRDTVFFSTSPIIEAYIMFIVSRCNRAFGLLGFDNLVSSVGFRFKMKLLNEKNKYIKYKRLFEIFESEIEGSVNQFVDIELSHDKHTKSVVIAPNKTEGWPAGRWPIHKFAEIIDHISTIYGYEIRIVGSPSEHAYASELLSLCKSEGHTNLAGKTSLAELFDVLNSAALVICNDSGVMHLSALVGTRCISIFSFSDPEVFAWPDLTLHISRHDYSCMPCVGHKILPQDNYPFNCPYMSRCDETVDTSYVKYYIDQNLDR